MVNSRIYINIEKFYFEFVKFFFLDFLCCIVLFLNEFFNFCFIFVFFELENNFGVFFFGVLI